jgi:hypothetical protein
MKHRGGRVLALALAFWLAAAASGCGGEPAPEESTEPAAAEPELPLETLPSLDAGFEPLPVTLEAVNESGVEGRAT